MIAKKDLVHGAYYEGTLGPKTPLTIGRWNERTEAFSVKTRVFGTEKVVHFPHLEEGSTYSTFTPHKLTTNTNDW